MQAAQGDSKPDLEAVADYLKIAMREDADFAKEIQALAQEVEENKIENNSRNTQIIRDHGKGYQNNSNNYGGTTQNINEQTNNYYGHPPD